MNAALIIILVITAVIGFVVIRARFYPYGPCPACTRKGRGKAGRSLGSGGRAWSKCSRCGGSGERIRPLAKIWPKHRAEALERKAGK